MSVNINPFESNPGWDLIKFVYHYYGLKDYVSFRYYDTFDKDKILEIEAYDFDNNPGDQKFWKEVISGGILPKQKLRLKDFKISSWFPRKPGQYWTYNAAYAREKAMRYHTEKIEKGGFVLEVYGKNLMTEVGGIGAVNFRKDRDYVLITATASGKTEQGIPLVCRKNVWEKIEPEFVKGKPIEVDLEGELVYIKEDNSSFFLRTPSIPKVAVLINSVLNIKIKSGMSEIIVSPWTLFETKDRWNPYGLTYINHSIFEDDINKSIKWMENYIDEHNGKTILTDFDENLHSLNAVFPLNDITNGTILTKEIIRFSQKVMKDFKSKNDHTIE